ncbi:uncharacterized protein LOC123873973 [Maniola jurtina]|uniref:uncharacterized protein LOC123873973 n=1 Tax=Maniola jurtina TaxID=191418 RepID=UPI001E68727C|nr:uncharacterized protein LOC123873973 [Maniola jurtina]
MEEKRSWTCEEVLSLIEYFKKYPNLWDKRNIYYKSKIKKHNAYKEMAAIFQTNTTEIDRKIKNIISQYQRERRYYKKFKKSGVGGNFIAKWFGYHAMSFMHDGSQRGTSEPWVYQNSDSGDPETLSDIHGPICEALHTEEAEVPAMLCEVDMDVKTEDEKPLVLPNTDKPQQAVLKLPRVIQKNQENHASKNVLQTLESIFQSRNFILQRDECDVFGEMVAQNLKQLKTEYAKVTVQNRINNLLYEARLGRYDHPPSAELNTSMATPSCSTTSDQVATSSKTDDNY